MKTTSASRILILALTSLSLIAHGGNERICALNDGYSDEFKVVGSCGDAGTVVLFEPEGSCRLALRGDDVGLPRDGKSDGGGELKGEVDWTEDALSCSISTHGSDRKRREVSCYADRQELCRSYFIPSDEECDVSECTIPTCAEEETLDLLDGDCCPSCVACPSCVPNETEKGAEPEPTCDPSACEALECEEHFEIREGTCCGRCVASVDETLCEEGRAAHQEDWEATRQEWLSCSADEDCHVIDSGTQCGRECGFVFSGRALGESYSELMSKSNERCQHCPAVTDSCPELTYVPHCVDGVCTL